MFAFFCPCFIAFVSFKIQRGNRQSRGKGGARVLMCGGEILQLPREGKRTLAREIHAWSNLFEGMGVVRRGSTRFDMVARCFCTSTMVQ